MLPVHSALKVRRTATTNRAIFLTMCFTGTCYVVVGVLGMLTFNKQDLRPNVLRSYGNVLTVDIARALIAAAVSCLYPLLRE